MSEEVYETFSVIPAGEIPLVRDAGDEVQREEVSLTPVGIGAVKVEFELNREEFDPSVYEALSRGDGTFYLTGTLSWDEFTPTV